MRLLAAVKIIALVYATSLYYVPYVLCKKVTMRDAITSTTVEDNNNNSNSNNDERILSELSSSSNNDYSYRRNYVAVIEAENFVTLLPNGGTVSEIISGIVVGAPGTIPQLQGSTTIQNGKIYDPADIAIVNRINGVERNDIPTESLKFSQVAIGLPFAGGRQPKQPIPPGDSAFFYHGYCTATSAINGDLDTVNRERQLCRRRQLDSKFDPFIDSLTVSSHSCKLNICLGGGGFNCISFYSGTSFVFDVGQQVIDDENRCGFGTEPSLPPPFPATIIGGTGSFEGIEGTVDIATICGTTGPIILGDGRLLKANPAASEIKVGYIVQSISINANMPLPVAP